MLSARLGKLEWISVETSDCSHTDSYRALGEFVYSVRPTGRESVLVVVKEVTRKKDHGEKEEVRSCD